MAYAVEVKELRPQAVATIRATTTQAEIGATLEQLLPEVWGYLERAGVQPGGPPFTRYHDYNPDRLEVEAGLPVPAPVAGEGRITAGELPGGRAAAVWHVGPYDRLSEAYEAVEAWTKDRGEEVAGPPWEVYWTDPGEVPNQADWKTEVLWPIR